MAEPKLRTWQFRRKGDADTVKHFGNATSLEEALENLRTPCLPDGWTDQDLENLEYREADRAYLPTDQDIRWGEWASTHRRNPTMQAAGRNQHHRLPPWRIFLAYHWRGFYVGLVIGVVLTAAVVLLGGV